MKKFITTVTLAAAALVAMAGAAGACHPELEVRATCEHITITARAWDTDDATQRHNDDIRVVLDGAQIGTGRFTAEAPSFTVNTKATAGRHTVRVVAMKAWGPAGEHGDALSSAEAVVEVPACAEYAVRIPEVRPAPVETTVVDAEVGTPQTLERQPAVVASAVLEQPTVLAITGLAVWQEVLIAVGGLVIGAGIVLATKVVRSKGVSAV